MSTSVVTVRRASSRTKLYTLLNSPHSQEHCAVYASVSKNLLATNEHYQIRLKRKVSGAHYSLFTVSETQSIASGFAYIGKGADKRLNKGVVRIVPGILVDQLFSGTIETQVTHPSYSDEQAEKWGEFVERLAGRGDFLAALAPHGGQIEPYTDQQAEHLALALGRKARYWVCKGWDPERGGPRAYEHWHITSTELSERSFPKLKELLKRLSTYTVAFHGWNKDYIGIGGRADTNLKNDIEDAIRRVVPTNIVVKQETSSGFSGNSRYNIVNRAAKLRDGKQNSIHIEQPLQVREDHWKVIAQAVADVYKNRSS